MSLLRQARSPYLSWLFSQCGQERHKTLSQAPGRALPKGAGTRELCHCHHLSRSSGVVLWGMTVMGWHLQGLASLLPNRLALLCLLTDSERVGQGQWTPYQTEWPRQIPARTSLHVGQRSFRRHGHYLYNAPPTGEMGSNGPLWHQGQLPWAWGWALVLKKLSGIPPPVPPVLCYSFEPLFLCNNFRGSESH